MKRRTKVPVVLSLENLGRGEASGRAVRRVPLLAAVVFVIVLAGVGATARAAAGDLDPSFGVGGRVTTDFSGSPSGAADLAIQADGRIVAAGSAGSPGDFALARYQPDGNLDASFGVGGTVITDFGLGDAAQGVALQADGKVVAAGHTGVSGDVADFALARYNLDGSLDASFGSGGRVTTDFAAGDDLAFDVAIQDDGKIVAVGRSSFPGEFVRYFALARYNDDGGLDASFGTGGKVTTGFAVGNGIALSIAIQADGKIVVAGWSGATSPDLNFALVRYNADGSLDASFGTDGKATTDFGSNDVAGDVAIQTDGKLVAAGWSGEPEFADFALARYQPDGSLDPSFGTDGKVTTDLFGRTDDQAFGVAIQTNGKIVAAGLTRVFFPAFLGGFGLARYNPDGSLDPSFGVGGKLTTDFGPGFDVASDLALQGDGKIVAAGSAPSMADFALARYDGDPSDTIPPDIICNATPSTLWPPNHSLAPVSTHITASDGSGSVIVTLLSASSSQPDSGLDPEDVPNDVQGWLVGTDDRAGLLRAERFGEARTYVLTYQAADPAGNTATCQASVTVPKTVRRT
jgi:uncharacterized delta-60 repeat protein